MHGRDDHQFIVFGHRCPFLDDPEKALEVNEGHSLVPWCGQNSLLIDRYDCRAFLQDLSEFDGIVSLEQEDYLSEEEIAIEKLCEFERYLELQMDIDDMTTQAALPTHTFDNREVAWSVPLMCLSPEATKRETETSRSKYGAVDFSYEEPGESPEAKVEAENGVPAEPQSDDTTNEPYICPPELKHLEGVIFPETDKQAQIIERTAVFVSRQGSQMEIILKAKQKSNPLFFFLNYDHDLNPFYKEMVKLIRQGRYVPKIRQSKPDPPVSDEHMEPNKSIQEDHYELKLPKVDISTTAYASLINKFKKVNELASQAKAAAASDSAQLDAVSKALPPSEPSADVATDSNQKPVSLPATNGIDTVSSSVDVTTNNTSPTLSKPSNETPNAQMSTAEYEQCYQEYYKHYYAHYYALFNDQQTNLSLHTGTPITDEQRAAIVDQAAKAAAAAASSAVNAMYQARINQNSAPLNASHTVAMTPGERGIIDKMAEYVARNGIEFEELVTRQKGSDPRFAFLKSDHPHYSYYLARRRQLLPDPPVSKVEDSSSKSDSQATSLVTEQSDPSKQPSDTTIVSEADSCASPSDTLNDRQSSISFKLARPCSSTKLQSSGSDVPSSVYVHSSIPPEYGPSASCPTLSDADKFSDRPITPTNSVVSDDASDSAALHRGRPKSPVRFSLPGIPSASSSSTSSPVSSRSASPECTPQRSPVRSPVIEQMVPANKRTSAPIRTVFKPERKKSEEPAPNPLLYPRTDIPCSYAPPVKHSPEVRSKKIASPSTPPLGTSAIETMLDNLENRSPSDDYKSTKLEEKLRQERRRRAAQLVAQLRAGGPAKPLSAAARVDPVERRPSFNAAASRLSSSPPPAPDSVPAAVAHAVVASLKRRHEQSLASLEAEAKARRRMRSPPSAYALPKERSHKSNSSRDTSSRHSSPMRDKDSSPDHRRSKHKKHHKSRR